MLRLKLPARRLLPEVSNFAQTAIWLKYSLSLLQKGLSMFVREQYRADAAKYSALAKTAIGPNEISQFGNLEHRFNKLADGEKRVMDHHDQTLACRGVW